MTKAKWNTLFSVSLTATEKGDKIEQKGGWLKIYSKKEKKINPIFEEYNYSQVTFLSPFNDCWYADFHPEGLPAISLSTSPIT